MKHLIIILFLIVTSCDFKTKEEVKKTTVLKFNGKEYKEATEINPISEYNADSSKIVDSKNNLSIQELMLLTKLKAIKKYGIPSSKEQFILNDGLLEFRNGISGKYTQKERQSESILIDEVTWEKDKNTWITVWYEVKQEKSVPKDVFLWEKGTEF